MPKFSKAFDLDAGKIAVSTSRFQGRDGEYSEDTVQAIVNKGKYDRNADEIIVWKDPDDGKYYVISGHSRWEASRRIFDKGLQPDLATMPVKEFIGDEDEAIDFATIESNRASTDEGLKSDLSAYHRAIARGWNRKRLLAAFKPETKLAKLKDLSHLNFKGPFITQMGTEAEKHFPYLERNARWVGVLRDQLPLTNEHEQEIFNFFYKENEAGQKLSKDQFFKLINDKVNRIDFDAANALNLKNRVSTSALTDPITDAIKGIDREIDKLNREATGKRESLATARQKGLTDVIPGIEKRISDINIILLRLVDEKQKLKQAAGRLEAQSFDLFSDPAPMPEPEKKPEPVKEPVPVKYTTNAKYEVGQLVNVTYGGVKYEGLPIVSVDYNDGNYMLPARWDHKVQLPNGKFVTDWRHHFEPFEKGVHTQGAETNPYPLADPDRSIIKIALRAYQGQSFNPETRGERFMRDMETHLQDILQEFTKVAAANGMQHLVQGAFNKYARKYREFGSQYLSKESGILSAMITGPARFPTSRNNKRQESLQNTYQEWTQKSNKAREAILKELRNEPDKLGDPRDLLTVEKKKLADLIYTREIYKEMNTAYRAFKKNPASLDKNTKLSEGIKNEIRNWKQVYSYEKAPIAPYQFQNLGANIKRVEQRVKEIEEKAKVADSGEVPEYIFEGGRVIYNAADNRIQIDFDDRPAKEIIAELKKKAFKWAPSVKLWQRAITGNALFDTAGLSFLNYTGSYKDLFKTPEAIEAEKAAQPVEEIKIVTDRAEVQKIKNAIMEGEMIVKSGRKVNGEKWSPEAIESMKRDIEIAKRRIGMDTETIVSPEKPVQEMNTEPKPRKNAKQPKSTDVPQGDIPLIDDDFKKMAGTKGIERAFVEREAIAKEKAMNKRYSPPERSKAKKIIATIVEETAPDGDLTTKQVIEIGRRINAERSLYSQFIDLGVDHQDRLWPTAQNLRKWAKDPGKYDLIGVDTFKRTDATIGANKGKEFLWYMMS